MIKYTLKEIYGDKIPPEAQQEELRISYQTDSDIFSDAQKIREQLAKDLELPQELIEECKIDLQQAYGHIVTIERDGQPRLHAIVVDVEAALNPDFHRKLISHELSHLFRIVTNQTGETRKEEEELAKQNADDLEFDLGDEIRAKFLESLQS